MKKAISLCAFLFLIIFFVLPALGDEKILGHITPLEEELLSPAIYLNCGVVVTEKNGGPVFDSKKMNELCSKAVDSFPEFLKKKNIKLKVSSKFAWSLSILPESRCYRCLNDLRFRFRNRQYQGDVIGYTDKNSNYTFMLNDSKDKEYNITFVHELFHAQSMFYGLYDMHSSDDNEKYKKDEVLANEFTSWLGY